MKYLFFAALFAASALTLSAQTDKTTEEDQYPEGWKLKGITGLNLSQTAQSNWSAGGDNSLAGTAYLNGSLSKKTGNWLWSSSLALEYGLADTKGQSTRKTGDKIDLSTQLGYSTDNKWYYTLMGDFKSQFDKGYNYVGNDKGEYISKFMAPAYSNISLGLEYRPNDNYSVYFSPSAGKLTFVQDDRLSDLGMFGVDKGDKFRAEFGAYLKAKAQKQIMENVNAVSTIDFFTAYDKSFGNVDINWDLLISMKVNKFLTATINTTLKYDDDVKSIDDNGNPAGPKIQFKEMLGIGVAYNF